MVQMGQLIDAAVASKPDGLVVSIPDADALGPHFQAAVKAGIPVIAINSRADVHHHPELLEHVGQEEYIAYKGSGEMMRAMGVKNVALDQRCQGFKDGLGEGARVEVLAVPPDFTVVRNAILPTSRRTPTYKGS